MKRETKPSRRLRMHIVLLCADGYRPSQIARVLYCSRTTVYTTARRFTTFADQRPRGPAAALDQRAQQRLERLVEQEHNFLRSRWTCPLLAWQLLRERGLAVSRETIRRALHRLGFRWRRPRPVPPPRNPEEKRQRLLQILAALRQLARAEGFFFQDETRLELNPKLGFAWMRRGHQQPLPTPGTNRKVWLSGALNWLTGRLHWVVGPRKDSELFLRLLEELRWSYRCHRRLHLALDNIWGASWCARAWPTVGGGSASIRCRPGVLRPILWSRSGGACMRRSPATIAVQT
jgi:transposase